MVAFQREYGHLNVPQNPNQVIRQKYPQLASFCKNQRSQYKQLQSDDTKHLSFLTPSRIQRLELIGFEWNFRQAAWESKYNELVEFWKTNGHSNVPSDCRDLHGWISYQRLKYKGTMKQKKDKNRTSNISSQYKPLTSNQIELLERANLEDVDFCISICQQGDRLGKFKRRNNPWEPARFSIALINM